MCERGEGVGSATWRRRDSPGAVAREEHFDTDCNFLCNKRTRRRHSKNLRDKLNKIERCAEFQC